MLERTDWDELQSLVSLLQEAAEVTPDWVELCELHQEAVAKMARRACPMCLADDPFEPDPLIDDPHAVGHPSVMLRAPRLKSLLHLPAKTGCVLRPGRVRVCEMCADRRSVGSSDVGGNDDHPLVGVSWRAAWSICDEMMATHASGQHVMFYDRTLADVIADGVAQHWSNEAGHWTNASVEVSNFYATVCVQIVTEPVGPWGALEDEGKAVELLEKLVPAFFHLRADGVDTAALRKPAGEWLQAADFWACQEKVVDILSQVADAAATGDHCLLEDELAVDLRFLLADTETAVNWVRALTSDLLTVTPEGYYSRWGWND